MQNANTTLSTLLGFNLLVAIRANSNMRTRTMCEKIKAKCVRCHDIMLQGV